MIRRGKIQDIFGFALIFETRLFFYRLCIEGNNPKEIDSNQQKKENKTKPIKEILSDDLLENKENKEQASKRQKKGVKEMIRRSKKIKNRLRDFKIYYQNDRGLKSKIDSLSEIIDDYEPTLICLVETHLSKKKNRFKYQGIKFLRMMAQTAAEVF